MNRYKLDYFPPTKKAVSRPKNRAWTTTLIAGICFFCFALFLFGGIGTAFQNRGQRPSLREQHDELRLRYDSLFAAKLQAEKQLLETRKQLRLLQNKK